MINGSSILTGSKFYRHLIFFTAALVILALGVWLFYIAGFRFKEMGLVAVNCLFFLLYIYSGRWLCGQWCLQGQPVRFFLFTALSFLALAFADWLLVKYLFHHPYAGFIELLYGAGPFFVAGLVSGILLKLISHSMQEELKQARVSAEQMESEFNLLQSQLSPHFLFNVLNNLYGISIEDHQRIPALLLKLSNLLRYSVYGFKKQFVPLQEELDYIKNYIEFEQIRISDRLVLTTNIEQVNDRDIKVAPLVLIVFIENAFKHAKNSLSQAISIDIDLKITGNFICFNVSNSCETQTEPADELTESSGLGLANTIRRLDLLYGSDYDLKQRKESNSYHVELQLKIK